MIIANERRLRELYAGEEFLDVPFKIKDLTYFIILNLIFNFISNNVSNLKRISKSALKKNCVHQRWRFKFVANFLIHYD